MNFIFLKLKLQIKYCRESFKQVSSIAIILFSSISLSYGQNENTNFKTNQVWLDFNTNTQVSEKLYISSIIGFKTISPRIWDKVYTNIEVSYNMPKLIFKEIKRKETIYGGINLSYINFIEGENTVEIGPYQGYSIFWPNTKKISLKHNIELKERFQWINGVNKYSFGLKTSYELEFSYRFYRDYINQNNGFFVGISSRFWWNMISTNIFNDVFRITPKIGYKFKSNWKIALYIGYSYTRGLATEKFNSDNILYRLRIYSPF